MIYCSKKESTGEWESCSCSQEVLPEQVWRVGALSVSHVDRAVVNSV